ncbi:hypothetical protein GW17_00053683 [Ensete ventricosum]|nr:hypothetical protein GW17_00053683 [Ensete ventricosum]
MVATIVAAQVTVLRAAGDRLAHGWAGAVPTGGAYRRCLYGRCPSVGLPQTSATPCGLVVGWPRAGSALAGWSPL